MKVFGVILLAVASVMAVPINQGVRVVPNSHVVLLKPTESNGFDAWINSEISQGSESPSGVTNQITSTFKAASGFGGLAGTFNDDLVAKIKARPDVIGVYPNQIHELSGSQRNAPWGLARISSRDKKATTYQYPDGAGEGVTAYVVDTGIRVTHKDFEGRASWGFNAVGGNITTDDHGHGSHVAGTIAGKTYGVAKKANVVAVKVCTKNGQCTSEAIVNGLTWVLDDAAKKAKGKSVANMSLGGSKDEAIDKAVSAAVKGGVAFAVAAGNENSDACDGSPSNLPEVVTIGAIDNADVQADFSNFGKCVDVYAPGVDIKSIWNKGDSSTNTISGTSMASPHGTGVLALYAAAGTFTPAELHDKIKKFATMNKITKLGTGSPNALLFNGNTADNSSSPAPTSAPTGEPQPTDDPEPTGDDPFPWPFPWPFPTGAAEN